MDTRFRLFFLALTMTYIAGAAVPVFAQEPTANPHPQAQAKYDGMSDEQKAAIDARRAKMQEKRDMFESLPPEEQQAIVEEAKKKVANFQSLSPEEKQAAIHETAAKRYEGLSDAQKAQVDARHEKAQKAKARYEGLSDEQKANIDEKRAKIREQRGTGKGVANKRLKERTNH